MKNVGDTARDNWPMIELAIKIWVFVDQNVRAEERTIVMECSISFGNFLKRGVDSQYRFSTSE